MKLRNIFGTPVTVVGVLIKKSEIDKHFPAPFQFSETIVESGGSANFTFEFEYFFLQNRVTNEQVSYTPI